MTTDRRPDVIARMIRFDLCDRCTMPRGDRHHSPGYRMARSPYDIPGHPFVDPCDGYDHDPSGRGCALAGRLAGGDPVDDFCRPCYRDAVRAPVPAHRILDSDSFDSFVVCANAGDGRDHGTLGSYAIVDGRHLCYACASPLIYPRPKLAPCPDCGTPRLHHLDSTCPVVSRPVDF